MTSILAGLDVLEEVLTAIGYRARTAMATEGVVGALARLITRKVPTSASVTWRCYHEYLHHCVLALPAGSELDRRSFVAPLLFAAMQQISHSSSA